MNSTEQGILHIEAGTLVVLSGLPGSGKSSLKARLCGLTPEQLEAAWVSTDALRERVLGSLVDLDERGSRYKRLHESANEFIYAMVSGIVRTRLAHGFTTFVDATNLTDADRASWVRLAEEAGARCLIVILDTSLEQCLENNRLRDKRVPEAVIREMHTPSLSAAAQAALKEGKGAVQPPQGFMTTSCYPHVLVGPETVIQVAPSELDGTAWDVVGDVHGLRDELLELLAKAGWRCEEGRLSHPQGRKLLFLGDLVDRGYDSLGVLRLVKRAVEDGVARCLLGNHEVKLMRFVETALAGKMERWTSYANAQTGMALLKLPASERDALVGFMRTLPPCVVSHAQQPIAGSVKTAFVHGDIHRFDPLATPSDDMVFGQSGTRRGFDSDAAYQARFDAGLNEYTVIRGHIPQTSVQDSIFSLERHPFQKGELVLMHLDQYLGGLDAGLGRREAFERALITQRCDYDFEDVTRRTWTMVKAMEELATRKLVHRQVDDTGLLRVYKYSKQTFWNNSWGESDWLLKARGLVLDVSGAIVSHPFDKVFNYGENGAGRDIPDDETVVVTDKLNGFLGIVSANPVKRGELLVHTQGGFGGPFVDYIRAYLDAKTTGLICRYLARNDVTLMFEVLHPEDPHIIQYAPEMMGLHLIGVRGKSLSDAAWTEEAVDAAAREMQLRRPGWWRESFGAAKARVKDARTEGVMVRRDDARQDTLVKMKSPYYLTTKFLGRLSKSRVAHLYGNPANFKQTIDEEFYAIVDALVAQVPKEQFLELSDDARVPLVRRLIDQMM